MNNFANQMGSPFYQGLLGDQLAAMRPGQMLPWNSGAASTFNSFLAQQQAGLYHGPVPKIEPSVQEQMESDVREWLSDWDK